MLVTGSRWTTGDDAVLVRHRLNRLCGPAIANGYLVIVVEGRSPRGGVDLVARLWAENTTGAIDEGHPADWDRYGRQAGMLRNAAMVRLGADVCLAFPSRDSVGTWDCVKRAVRAGIRAEVYPITGKLPEDIETVVIPGV